MFSFLAPALVFVLVFLLVLFIVVFIIAESADRAAKTLEFPARIKSILGINRSRYILFMIFCLGLSTLITYSIYDRVIVPIINLPQYLLPRPSNGELANLLEIRNLSQIERHNIQDALQTLGYLHAAGAGTLGPETQSAIQAYQRSLSWEATGQLTIEQWARLLNRQTPSGPQGMVPIAGAYPQSGSFFQDRGADGALCQDCPWMVVIPAGSFTMGSPDSEASQENVPTEQARYERPQHLVTIRHPFALGRYAVTRREFAAFVAATGSAFSGGCYSQSDRPDTSRNWQTPGFRQEDGDPVVCVSWEDAEAYVQWLSQLTGRTYRLPTESEWEYAARAGTTTARYWDDDASTQCLHANGADLSARPFVSITVVNCSDNYPYTSPAGSFPENPFKLYDMLGNVWQWTQDCWNDTHFSIPSNELPRDSGNCHIRTLRGGSWANSPSTLRAATRRPSVVGLRQIITGFRVARSLQ